MADAGFALDGSLAEGGVTGRDGAPAEEAKAFGLQQLDEHAFAFGANLGVWGEIEHANTVVSGLWQGSDAGGRGYFGEETMRELE